MSEKKADASRKRALATNEIRHAIGAFRRAAEGARSLPTLERQPVHVVYGGAHLFGVETPSKLAQLARKTLLDHAPTSEELDRALGLSPAHGIHARVLKKLEREAVEDLRIDFEDGYGNRPDPEEDAEAARVGETLAESERRKALPPFCGIRIKSLLPATAERSLRTLDIVLSAYISSAGPALPQNFVVTLPKVIRAEQVHAFAGVLGKLERRLRLAPRSLRFEIMVEMPELLMNPDGKCELPRLIGASDGRLAAAHFGAYDYLSGCDVASVDQALDHRACDHARQLMQLSYSGTEVRLSDGATQILPIGPHRAAPGKALSPQQIGQNHAAVLEAWRLSYRHVRRSLSQGFYQGWDLHPAQIPARYAAIYSFFAENAAASARRLKAFLEKAAQASLVGSHFDDEASAQGLLAFFIRGYGCGALDDPALAAAGLTAESLRSRSFRELLPKSRSR